MTIQTNFRQGEAGEKEVVTLTTTTETNVRQSQDDDAALVAAKGKEEVATLTATTETNLWQGDLETEAELETESNEALSEWEVHRTGLRLLAKAEATAWLDVLTAPREFSLFFY